MDSIAIGIAWCVAWGDRREPQFAIDVLQEMRRALASGEEVPAQVREIVDRVRELLAIPEKISREEFPQTITDLQNKYPNLWNQPGKIGLVYGGVTKVKQYVFEDAKLPDIRGASALLDRINLLDLPAFFDKRPESPSDKIQSLEVRKWLGKNFGGQPKLSEALIPEMIVYSTGGNILAFCPAAFVNELSDAIEKRYSFVTLTANSCAVGDKFNLLEIRFGLLRDSIEQTFWLDKYRQTYNDAVVEAYFGKLDRESNEPVQVSHVEEAFINRKSFNELTTKLAVMFNQRRSGNDFENRPSRRYPPMLETHPYLQRDESDRRSAITRATDNPDNRSEKGLPGSPWFSEVSARKRKAGDRAKNGIMKETHWYTNEEWAADVIEGWVDKFEDFLKKHPGKLQKYCGNREIKTVEVAQSLTQLGSMSNGFVAYIYADGNNMGGYIQKITTPQEYQNFSEDVDNATKYAVFQALAEHLHPRQVKENNKSESTLPDGAWIHPFEIITIGGDDIILIVPADRALAIAKTIGEQFEQILLKQVEISGVNIKGNYQANLQEKPIDLSKCHRYLSPDLEKQPKPSNCQLSTSIGVLIADYKTPIYYAKKLYEQLLKSAKKRAKELKKHGYCGGTVDFLVMKSVTAISSSIEDFRNEALTKDSSPKLKLYAAPYTLYEIGGLIESVKALKKAEFPKSQLYQIRSFLEQGKQTTILNYRYFRTRLKDVNSKLLQEKFEEAWCKPKNPENNGNLAPWMSVIEENKLTVYETIWREIVDIYDFIEIEEDSQLSSEISVDAEVEL
ncbi:type III-B CRISPR-associated protein Cas10/Cmr2 [Microcoleus sp. bin38.metabat.b11b12b14.051]|uniref:type III-B CRISPR-associated protein Cas10/Cmr2 n=1 Tax=Microcoleus sp. bin38.metabat.b11b12b14.051 TaxID=2742709 RepID=UPI0025D3C669|nr:type III-B CRISPR-associated protein Cas10/Cmr2 [Microcoleus sp. bin38.metabat.b11b12b14.051]